MRIEVITTTELSGDLLARWRAIQQADPLLASPYFCPEFTQAVAAVRKDVFVGVLEEAGQVVGFFPHQRGPLGVGQPVGGPLSDFHGLIGTPELAVDAVALLAACDLTSWSFHHLLAAQPIFEPYHANVDESHYLDLSGGFAGYAELLRAQGSHLLKDVRAKRRKLERDFGPLRFVPHTTDPAVLQALFDWKSNQYRDSGLVDVFSFDWTRTLLRHLHGVQEPSFGSMLSALYAGEDLAAVHFGMRSHAVWNWWFPRHAERFYKYSPGIVLRISAAEVAPALGLVRIDLGCGGDDTYKPRLRTGGIPLATGTVERPSWAATMRRWRRTTEAWVRRSPLLPLVRAPGRLLTRMERWGRFR
ncbi:MAG: GNAT family N-acetyltransferase [Phycisphaerales bacterium]|nr:GNAT family N-acetyltransferase [Phycisphaerales bacterium]